MKKSSSKKLLKLQKEKSKEKLYLQEKEEKMLAFLHDSNGGKEIKFTLVT